MVTPNYTDWQGYYHAFRTDERLMNAGGKFVINYATSDKKPIDVSSVFPDSETVQLEDGSFNIVLKEIPKEVGFPQITDLDEDNISPLVSITIPEGVKAISDGGFMYYGNLSEINLPKSLKTIGTYGFGCTGLTSFVIPENVETIGLAAFASSPFLTNVIIPNSVKVIKESAFAGVANIMYSGDAEDTEGNRWGAFYQNGLVENGLVFTEDKTKVIVGGCLGITSAIIPDSVIQIENAAFENRQLLTSVTFGNRLKTIGSNAFNSCYALKSLTLPASLREIGTYAFEQCDHLTSVQMEEGIETIATCAFKDCVGLTSITLPNSVTTLGEEVFKNCTGLKTFTTGTKLDSIGNQAFYTATNLETFTCNAMRVPTLTGDNTFSSTIKTIRVPSTLVDQYKADEKWAVYADKIQAI